MLTVFTILIYITPVGTKHKVQQGLMGIPLVLQLFSPKTQRKLGIIEVSDSFTGDHESLTSVITTM